MTELPRDLLNFQLHRLFIKLDLITDTLAAMIL